MKVNIKSEKIKNEQIIKLLIEHGDDLITKREIDCWFYFKESKKRNEFKNYMIDNGFMYIDEYYVKKKHEKYPYGLIIRYIDSIDLNKVNEFTETYIKKSEEYMGYFDGWETKVIINKS